ncbi:MAG TPA: M50 family metallopeptidase [Candidatus Dormibacteraeota bacterium]|nr:M50 family metallopeptidase [Candidatus Dormibacteraeota bacterium]
MLLFAVIPFALLGKILTFLLMLSVLVVLHELGHFILARRNGVRVNEFAVGMGPKIAGFVSERSGTLYSLRMLPIGGYCAMLGEDGERTQAAQQREFLGTNRRADGDFQGKKPLARLAIILAGPIANFILAYIILLVGIVAFGVASGNASRTVAQVMSGSPAAALGIAPGDRILRIDGVAVTDGQMLIARLHASLHRTLKIEFGAGSRVRHGTVTPEPCPQNVKQGCIGILPSVPYLRVGLGEAFIDAGYTYGLIAQQSFGSIAMLATHFTKYAGQVSGPIGIGRAAIAIQDLGWGPYFALAATISFALGLFNLLPIPALDGGRAAFIIAELLRGKPVDPDREAMVHFAGFAVVLALFAVIAVHDIGNIIAGHGALN